MKHLKYILLLLFLPLHLFSQSPSYPIDSTYTVARSFEKVKKYYPDISIAQNRINSHINSATGLVYKKIGERSLHLDIYSPKETSNDLRPVILMVHGGGWSSGTKSHMEVIGRDLAFNGYVAIPVEYRLSPEIQYPAGIEDLQDALKWLVKNGKKYGADKDRIFVLGASAGAHLASFLGTTENDRLPYKKTKSNHIKGIINIDGIVSFVHPEADKEGDAASRWLGGPPTTHYQNWKEASPLEYVDKHSPAILFVNGSQPRFHAGRDSMREIYDELGIYHDTFEFGDAPHTFWFFHPWYTPMMYRVLNFLRLVSEP